MTICLTPAGTLNYDEGGGHFWAFLNWALGLRSLGYRVIWLELVGALSPQRLARNVPILKRNLERYGLGDSLALGMRSGAPLPEDIRRMCLSVEEAVEADLLLDLHYSMPAGIVRRFSRSALVDLDPGLLQLWMSGGAFETPRHDVYFTIGETVGKLGTGVPACGIEWHYTPPPVSLEHWLPTPAPADAPYTTVAHWFYGDMTWQGESFNNDKRASFLDYLTLPSLVSAPLELALCLGDKDDATDPERLLWESHRWSVRHSWSVTSTPSDYQSYIQQSRGEFSCAKPSCMKLQNAWVSDRTLCYLAAGKPAIVQHTGASRILPDAGGLLRFRTLAEASAAIERVEADYENQCRLARALAEEHFDAHKVVRAVLEKALE